MRVYSPVGEPYDGEPVDCRELKSSQGYTDLHPDDIAELQEQARQRVIAEGKAAKAEADAAAKAKAKADAEAEATAKAEAAEKAKADSGKPAAKV